MRHALHPAIRSLSTSAGSTCNDIPIGNCANDDSSYSISDQNGTNIASIGEQNTAATPVAVSPTSTTVYTLSCGFLTATTTVVNNPGQIEVNP
jgi:hypothetical protein